VKTALEAGLMELGAEWAYVARFGDDAFEIMFSAGTRPERIPLDAERARIRAELENEDVFAFSDPAAWPPLRRGGVHANGRTDDHLDDRSYYIRALGVLIGSAIQQAERTKRLDALAFGDALTGLPNRALLQDRLEQTLLSARRHRRSFAAHYVDIDHFKDINDSYGHHVGDAVLVAVSSWLRSVLRESDTIGRIGSRSVNLLRGRRLWLFRSGFLGRGRRLGRRLGRVRAR
jgi:predicted signal transduction protein with EAL and GGDEF domain